MAGASHLPALAASAAGASKHTKCRENAIVSRKEKGIDMSDVWVANHDGTDIVRARDISEVGLDYDGNVTARLVGREGTVVTLVAHRADHGEQQPGDLHRQLVRVIAELSDASGAHLVRPVYAESSGWQWVSEPL